MENQTPSKIHFFTEELDFQIADEEKYRLWILGAIARENQVAENINYIFCSDDYLLALNKEHLQHDYYTDVISFPYSTDPVEGDIFISIDRVKDNAVTLEVDFKKELSRVMIHGVLHFLGYGDKSEEEVVIMRTKEDEYLELLAST